MRIRPERTPAAARASVVRTAARVLVLAAIMSAPVPPFAQVVRPPAGQTLDRSFEVALASRIDRPCIAVRANGAAVLIARAPLDAAVAARPARWRTEAEREALIRGDRAKLLLERARGGPDHAGCASVDARSIGDAGHLLVEWLEAGRAAVVADGAVAADRAITIRYVGNAPAPHVGRGDIRFLRGEPRREFLRVEWWAS